MAALSAASSAAAAASTAPRPQQQQPQRPPRRPPTTATTTTARRRRRPRLLAPVAASSSASAPSTAGEPSQATASPSGPAVALPPRQAGRVRSVTAREAGEMMAGIVGTSGGSSSSGGGASSGGDNSSITTGARGAPPAAAPSGGPPAGERWTLLDVRPPHEQKKVPIEGAAPVPFFIADPDGASLAGLLRAAASFGMGGWWLGGAPLVPNPDFLEQAAAALPSDRQSARVVVACQKGLRSLAACEALIRAGFPHVAWVSGGLDSALPGDLPTPGGKDVRYAGIGGVSEALGWTEVQREARRARRGAATSDLSGVFALAGAVLGMDLLLFAYEHWASTHPGWPNPFQY